MDIDKMIHALKLAKDCTYADVMTESAKEFLRMKIDEALKQEQELPIDSDIVCDCTHTQACKICGEKKGFSSKEFWNNLKS